MLEGERREGRARLVLAAGRHRRACAPETPCRLVRLGARHRVDRGADVSPGARTERRSHTPRVHVGRHRVGQRLAPDVVRPGDELAGGVVGEPRVAPRPFRCGQLAPPLEPPLASALGIAPRRALQRVERELVAVSVVPAKPALQEPERRLLVDVLERPRGNPVGVGQVARDLLREAQVPRLEREAVARPPVVDRDRPARDERGEQRLAGGRRRLAREPERLRGERARRRRTAAARPRARSTGSRRPRSRRCRRQRRSAPSHLSCPAPSASRPGRAPRAGSTRSARRTRAPPRAPPCRCRA